MNDHVWRNAKVPNSAIGRRIEHWNRADEGSWFQVIGRLIELDGEPGMDPREVEHMEFHEHPPGPTEGTQIWRYIE